MKQLKRFAVACILIASLSAVAMADGGSTQGPYGPDPGDGHSPGIAAPGETSTPPGETQSPPGDTQGPSMSALASVLAWLGEAL